ncbi:alpha/beta-hydrolase family protein [Rhodococcus sp. Q1]|uniref:alpha/beta hydrolase n=2 Tax=unclassified Rhodococcus (in: high G+C Gram-positive bacteria) TaxID=192944 RepID=UPI00101F25A2|nr:alpha/beta-hydrolase family protein [Rhodococcus sp. Q1]
MPATRVDRLAAFEARQGRIIAAVTDFGDRHPLTARVWGWLGLDFTGIAFAALFFCWSLTPSLLPRDWLFQGLIGGINAAIGYGVGCVVGWAVARFVLSGRRWWPPPLPVLRAIKVAVPVAAVLASLVALVLSAGEQRQLAALMGAEGSTTSGYLRTILLSLAVAAALIALWRGLRDIGRWISAQLSRRTGMPLGLARTLGVLVVVLATFMLIDGVLIRGAYAVVNQAFGLQDDTTRPGAVQPVEPAKSGSPESLAPWETLGFEGRNFVARGLDAEELAAVNGRPALEPIRVYVGLDTAPTPEERIDLVLGELERTGAFERSTLVLIPTTGTGWVNPTAARAMELVHNGDLAMVAWQYSYLPSWISFLADREKAAAAGEMLVDRVYERWSQLPEDDRPDLFLYGESLGTQSGEGAFDSLAEIRARMDGVLWVGPPNSNRLWRQLVERRDPGSTEVQPVYADGLVVRFADSREAIHEPDTPWLSPRVLYIQHASDPVVWWSPDLLFSRPDWLSEPPGPDRLPQMRWFPFVTFWQVSADLTNAAGVPDGHGHNYGSAVLEGWIAVTRPEGWTENDTERVRIALEAFADHDGPEK